MIVSVAMALFASFLFSITNHIDKYMISKTDNKKTNIKTLLIFSSLIVGIVFSPILLVINKFAVYINWISLIFTILAAALYLLAT